MNENITQEFDYKDGKLLNLGLIQKLSIVIISFEKFFVILILDF